MHQASQPEKLQTTDLTEVLRSCAYTIFAPQEFSDEGKPEFLKIKQDLRLDFNEFVVANIDEICLEIGLMSNPTDRICISYSLFKFVGDELPKESYKYLKEKILIDYLGMLMATMVIKKSEVQEPVRFLLDCLKLMLPVVLPLAIKIVTEGADFIYSMSHRERIHFKDLSIFNNITTVSELFDLFFSEYRDLKISSLDEYLEWLYQSLYFVYILLHQNDELLAVGHIEKIVLFIELKLEGVKRKHLLAAKGLARAQLCLKVLLSIDSDVLPANAEVYQATKSLLFSLLLEVLLPMPHIINKTQHDAFIYCLYNISLVDFSAAKLSERQSAEIAIALLSLSHTDTLYFMRHVGSFSLGLLIELVQRIRLESLKTASFMACVRYLDVIVRHSKLAAKDYALAEGRVFFEVTKGEFVFLFKGAFSRVLQLFYSCPDNCYQVLEHFHKSKGIKEPVSVKKVLNLYDFSLLMGGYKAYKNLFAPAESLLQEFYMISFDIMNQTKGWGRKKSCLLFKAVLESIEESGMQVGDMYFMSIKQSCLQLIEEAPVAGEIILTANSLIFWERLFEVFPAMQKESTGWSIDQQREIDQLFLRIIPKTSFDEDSPLALFAARLYVIMTNIISLDARVTLYPYIGEVLGVLNKQHLDLSSDLSSDLIYQLSLIKIWLLEYAEQNCEVDNSEVLARVYIFAQPEALLISRVLYLSQLAEVLYLVMMRAECFYREEGLYSKITEIITFLFKERAELGVILKVVEAVPFDSKVAILLGHGQNFIDHDLIDLIKVKVGDVLYEPSKAIVASRHNSYDVLAITNVSFSKDNMIIHCSMAIFSLSLNRALKFKILKAKVRYYKKQATFALFTGDEADKLIPLTKVKEIAAAETLTDEQLLALFGVDEKPAAKFGKKPSQEAGYAKAKKSSKAKKAAKLASTTAIKSSLAAASIPLNVVVNAVVDAVADTVVGAVADDMVGAVITAKKPVQKLLKSSMQDEKELVVDAATKVERSYEHPYCEADKDFLAEVGANSFARLIYNDAGKVIKVAPTEALLEHFSLPAFGVKKGLVAAVARLQNALLARIKDKLKGGVNIVEFCVEGATLSLSLSWVDAGAGLGAAAIAESPEDVCLTATCNLREISSEQLWPEILEMHASLLQRQLFQQYGGNMALASLEFDLGRNLIAIAPSDYLPAASVVLQRVEVAGGGRAQAFEAFFAPFAAATLKLFSALSVEQVEFILRISAYSEAGIFIYGHPVVEYCYGDALRVSRSSSSIAKHPVQQLVIMLNNSLPLRLDILRESGAFIKGVKPYAVYCSYKGYNVTVCLDPNYMNESIFKGDHFCCLLESSTFAYSDVNRPVELGPAVVPSLKSGIEIFAENKYALKVALRWNKIMGKFGGGLRKILENIGFISVIAAADLEGVTWHRSAGSQELLPGATQYMQSTFNLGSEVDVAEVLKEADAMLKAELMSW